MVIRINKLLIFSILLICLLIRLSSYFFLYQNGTVLIENPDAQYHMRRILLAIFSPPLGYLDFFTGMTPEKVCIWPVYHDLFYALIILIVNLGQNITPEKAVLTAAFIPPVIGTLSAFILFKLCRNMSKGLALLTFFYSLFYLQILIYQYLQI